MQAQSEKVELHRQNTKACFDGLILLSLRTAEIYSNSCGVSVGSVGFPTVTTELTVGDVVMFEVGDQGRFEIRLTKRWGNSAAFIVSRLN